MPGRDYDQVVNEYTTMFDLGFYNYGGNDAASFDQEAFCAENWTLKMCSDMGDDDDGKSLNENRASSVNQSLYFA